MTVPRAVRPDLVEKEITGEIIAAFFYVYNRLGFGNIEANHCRALELVLKRRGLRVEREYPATVYFDGEPIGLHRIDMLVERKVVVEVKSTDCDPSRSELDPAVSDSFRPIVIPRSSCGRRSRNARAPRGSLPAALLVSADLQLTRGTTPTPAPETRAAAVTAPSP